MMHKLPLHPTGNVMWEMQVICWYNYTNCCSPHNSFLYQQSWFTERSYTHMHCFFKIYSILQLQDKLLFQMLVANIYYAYITFCQVYCAMNIPKLQLCLVSHATQNMCMEIYFSSSLQKNVGNGYTVNYTIMNVFCSMLCTIQLFHT